MWQSNLPEPAALPTPRSGSYYLDGLMKPHIDYWWSTSTISRRSTPMHPNVWQNNRQWRVITSVPPRSSAICCSSHDPTEPSDVAPEPVHEPPSDSFVRQGRIVPVQASDAPSLDEQGTEAWLWRSGARSGTSRSESTVSGFARQLGSRTGNRPSAARRNRSRDPRRDSRSEDHDPEPRGMLVVWTMEVISGT